MRGVHVARRSFLQKEFGCLHDRLGMKAGSHRALVKRIGECDQCHALVVRHVGVHDRDLLAVRETGRRVVEGLIPAIRTTPARGGQTRKVPHRRAAPDLGNRFR